MSESQGGAKNRYKPLVAILVAPAASIARTLAYSRCFEADYRKQNYVE
ncbi:MAG: hypothetical protein IPK68_13825 [Bdellovibrionales bacterium]|nr:hypothetical protein [Bdellovibrionales bacterium]